MLCDCAVDLASAGVAPPLLKQVAGALCWHAVAESGDAGGAPTQVLDTLAEADAALNNFLTTNQIGDFVAEKASLSQLQAQIEQHPAGQGAQALGLGLLLIETEAPAGPEARHPFR